MVSSELVALAESGANVLVTAMATSAWNAVRGGFVKVLSRNRSPEVAGAELDLAKARIDHDGTSRDAAVQEWAAQLREVLVRHEDAIAELRELITRDEPSIQVRNTGKVVNTRSSRSINITGNAGNVTYGTGE